jgi:transposase
MIRFRQGDLTMARFDLTDFEWSIIQPLLPTKVRGVKRVDDRRVLNGIFWRLRTGAPWADIPARYGPHTTCVNRFNRWRRAGVWARILEAVSKAYDGDIQMIDSSSIRVHQACCQRPKNVWPAPSARVISHGVFGLHQRIRSQGLNPGQDGIRAPRA